jgi:hypothetical protein
MDFVSSDLKMRFALRPRKIAPGTSGDPMKDILVIGGGKIGSVVAALSTAKRPCNALRSWAGSATSSSKVFRRGLPPVVICASVAAERSATVTR